MEGIMETEATATTEGDAPSLVVEHIESCRGAIGVDEKVSARRSAAEGDAVRVVRRRG
jgi:hypothetical protein